MQPNEISKKWTDLRVRHYHRHPPLVNVNQAAAVALPPGWKLADSLAAVMGSWSFIILQSVLLAAWIVANAVAWTRHWDPYPFILLNLALSFQAAYAAPIIMMSQNRLATKDRLMAEQDYMVNSKAEEEVKAMMHHLEMQDELMIDLLQRMEEQHRTIMEVLAAMGLNIGKQSVPA